MKMTRKALWLILHLLPGIGNELGVRLLKKFKDIESLFTASRSQLSEVTGMTREKVEQILNYQKFVSVAEEWNLSKKLGAKIITLEDKAYPKNLKEIYSPPLLLYLKGELVPEDEFSVSIVGSRLSSSYGKTVSEALASNLAEAGFTIVSGLARGIDSASHRGALAGGGRTLAVLGTGIDIIYPPENRELATRISKNGALLTEFPCGTPPKKWNFPVRNRLISGLSLGTVVVEAAERSGALITANFALEQGREVFAIPGRTTSKLSKGCNKLIKEGAKLVEDWRDIITELEARLPAHFRKSYQKPKPELPAEEETILNSLSSEPIDIDNIIIKNNLPVGKVLLSLLNLEMKGLVKQLPGKMYVRK
jgi:DNA processing protein